MAGAQSPPKSGEGLHTIWGQWMGQTRNAEGWELGIGCWGEVRAIKPTPAVQFQHRLPSFTHLGESGLNLLGANGAPFPCSRCWNRSPLMTPSIHYSLHPCIFLLGVPETLPWGFLWPFGAHLTRSVRTFGDQPLTNDRQSRLINALDSLPLLWDISEAGSCHLLAVPSGITPQWYSAH